MAAWLYAFDTSCEALVRFGDRLGPWLGVVGITFTVFGLLLVCRRLYSPVLLRQQLAIFVQHPLLQKLFAAPVSGGTEDAITLSGGLVLVISLGFTALRRFTLRGVL